MPTDVYGMAAGGLAPVLAGRMPLMLAAESDCKEASELMHRYGGDRLQTDVEGMNCLCIALAFGAAEVAASLRSAARQLRNVSRLAPVASTPDGHFKLPHL
jgi:ankyrin repeat protein